jgi:hypothetical protein
MKNDKFYVPTLSFIALILLAIPSLAAKRSNISFSVSGYTDTSHIERSSNTNPNYSIDSTSGTTILANADFNFTPKFSLFAYGGTSTYDYDGSPTRTITDNDGEYTNLGGGMKLTFGDFSFALHGNSRPVLFLEEITSSNTRIRQIDNNYGVASLRFGASSTYYELAIKLEGGSSLTGPEFQQTKLKSISYMQGEVSVIFGSNGKGSSDNSIGQESDFIYGINMRMKEEGYSYNGDDYKISDIGAGVFVALN